MTCLLVLMKSNENQWIIALPGDRLTDDQISPILHSPTPPLPLVRQLPLLPIYKAGL